MKKAALILTLLGSFMLQAQNFGAINDILDRLEERSGINQHLENLSVENKKFVLIKDFNDRKERSFIVIKGNDATYVQIFDDKVSGKSSSNVFTGDVIRKKNILSLRADKLENQRIPIPLTKTLLLTRQKDIVYLIDINTKERWIDEASYSKK